MYARIAIKIAIESLTFLATCSILPLIRVNNTKMTKGLRKSAKYGSLSLMMETI